MVKQLSPWCFISDSNRNAFQQWYLKPSCLPIPPMKRMVRDRVLETLRLMASELKSDVSPNSTNPAYLTYIMDYIILYFVCQEVFYFFWNNLSLHTGLVLRLPVPHRIHYASTLILSVPLSNSYETDRSVNPCLVAPLALRHGLLLMALSFITVIDYL